MKLLKQASQDFLQDMEEDIDMEFSSIIPEVENRVSCLLWEQYQKALGVVLTAVQDMREGLETLARYRH